MGTERGVTARDRQVTWAGVLMEASLREAPGAGCERTRSGRRLSRAAGTACAKVLGQDVPGVLEEQRGLSTAPAK